MDKNNNINNNEANIVANSVSANAANVDIINDNVKENNIVNNNLNTNNKVVSNKENKTRKTIIILSCILFVWCLICAYCGYDYYKTLKEKKDNENINSENNNNQVENNEDGNSSETEVEDVIINYPKELTSLEINNIQKNTVDILYSQRDGYKQSIENYNTALISTFYKYKHNSSASFGYMVQEDDYKVLTVKNGKLVFTETNNTYNITGVDGTVVAVESSCYLKNCDVFVLTQDGSLYYKDYRIEMGDSAYQKDWTFTKVDLEEKVNKIRRSKLRAPFSSQNDDNTEFGERELWGKSTILIETETGIYRIYKLGNEIVKPKKILSEEFTLIKGFSIANEENKLFAIDINGNPFMVNIVNNIVLKKELLYNMNSITIKDYFILYSQQNENDYFGRGDWVIYLLSEDDQLYYYAGGNDLKKYSNSKVKNLKYDIDYLIINFENNKDDFEILCKTNEEFYDDEDL